MDYLEFTDNLLKVPDNVCNARSKADLDELTSDFYSALLSRESGEVVKAEDFSATISSLTKAKIFTKLEAEDAFYSLKTGYAVNGVPPKLLFLLSKLLGISKKFAYAPNQAMCKVYRHFAPYVGFKYFINGEYVTLAELISSFTHVNDVNWIQSYNLVVPVYNHPNKISEAYYNDNSVEAVATLPEDIAKEFPHDSWLLVKYKKESGLVIESDGVDVPLRKFNGRLGIVLDDFKLEKAV